MTAQIYYCTYRLVQDDDKINEARAQTWAETAMVGGPATEMVVEAATELAAEENLLAPRGMQLVSHNQKFDLRESHDRASA